MQKPDIQHLIHFLRYDMWRLTTAELNGLTAKTRLGYYTLRTVVLVIRGFTSKNLNDKARSLTYSLIFTLVPILAMVVAVAKGFGVDTVIEAQLQKSFLGETNLIPTIMAMVERYLDTAQGGVFIGVGILILLWAVYSFFSSVETAFNEIWNVHNTRSIVRRVSTYIAVLFLIPVLLIVSSGLSIFVQSVFAHSAHEGFAHVVFHEYGVRLLQFAICWVMFTLMYIAIPNTRVKLLSALIPGVIFGTLFQALQMLSVYIILFLGRTSIVYGAFATIPILLTWLEWTCLLIMIGAEMSYAIQNNQEYEYEHELEHMSRRYKDYITLYLLRCIIDRFEQEQPAASAIDLAVGNTLPVRLVYQLLSRLVEVGLLTEITSETESEVRYLPSFDTHKMSIGMILERIDCQGEEGFTGANNVRMQAFWDRYTTLKQQHNTLQDVLLNEIN